MDDRRDPLRARGRARGDLAHARTRPTTACTSCSPHTLWPDHPLGRPVLGERETVGGVRPRAEHRATSDRHYVTGNVVVAAAGDVDHDALVALVQRHLTLPEGDRAQPRSTRRRRSSRGSRSSRKDTEQAHICWGVAGLNARDDDRFALAVLDTSLGGGMSLAAVPGDPREAGPGVRGLQLPQPVPGHRRVRRLRGHAAGQRRAGRPAHPGRGRPRAAGRHHRRGARPREGVDQGPAGARAGEHAQPHDPARQGEVTHGESCSLDELVERVDAVSAATTST